MRKLPPTPFIAAGTLVVSIGRKSFPGKTAPAVRDLGHHRGGVPAARGSCLRKFLPAPFIAASPQRFLFSCGVQFSSIEDSRAGGVGRAEVPQRRDSGTLFPRLTHSATTGTRMSSLVGPREARVVSTRHLKSAPREARV